MVFFKHSSHMFDAEMFKRERKETGWGREEYNEEQENNKKNFSVTM